MKYIRKKQTRSYVQSNFREEIIRIGFYLFVLIYFIGNTKQQHGRKRKKMVGAEKKKKKNHKHKIDKKRNTKAFQKNIFKKNVSNKFKNKKKGAH